MKEFFEKNKKIIAIVTGSVVLSLGIGFAVGDSEMKAKVITKEKTYSEYVADIKDLKEEVKDLEKVKAELNALEEEKEGLREELQAAKNLIAKKDTLQKSVDDLTAKVSSVQSALDIKVEELEALEGKVLAKKAEPITLGAGQYVVGQDIPAGRYLAEPNGEGSNFVVYGSNGGLVVNTILGRHGEPSYSFFIDEGGIIETRAAVKLTAVE